MLVLRGLDLTMPNLTAALPLIFKHVELEPSANVSCDAKSFAVLHVPDRVVCEVALGLVIFVISAAAPSNASINRLQVLGWPAITLAGETWIRLKPWKAVVLNGGDALLAGPDLTAAKAVLNALAPWLVGQTKFLTGLLREFAMNLAIGSFAVPRPTSPTGDTARVGSIAASEVFPVALAYLRGS